MIDLLINALLVLFLLALIAAAGRVRKAKLTETQRLVNQVEAKLRKENSK